jgi:hypothetical protein
LCGREEYLPVVIVDSNEGNLLSIRRPAGQVRLRRRIGELQAIAAVGMASPESVIGIGHVDDPLAVARKVQLTGRDSGKKRDELLGVGIVANKLSTRL